jgi:hypothetical protein
MLAVLLVAGCASSVVTRDPERTNEVMITFVQRAQSGFWKEAMENVTPSERADMMEDGQVMQEYKDAVGRIRLSTIRKMNLGLDSRGRLVGLIDVLDESNNMYRASSESGPPPALVDDFDIDMPVEKPKAAAKEEEKPPEDDEFSSFLETLRKAASEPSEPSPEEEEE